MFRFYSNPAERERISVVGEHSEGVLKLAVARCSRKDNFYRKKGRAIAEGRLAKGKLHSAIPMESCDTHTFVTIATQIAEQVRFTKKIYN